MCASGAGFALHSFIRNGIIIKECAFFSGGVNPRSSVAYARKDEEELN